jgi:hypothetical protein
MKPTKILMCAMAVGAMIFAAGKVSATLGVVNVSGTALTETDSNPSSGIYVGKVTKKSFKTKDILSLLADATTNTWFTDKKSELVYDLDAYNADATTAYNSDIDVYGIFYVTNTSTHAVFRLDGVNGSSDYWSYVEFDSYNGNNDFVLGFGNDPSLGENSVTSYKENDTTGKGSSKTTQSALLYIHDNPSRFDITDNPGEIFSNDNALIIRGLGTFSYSRTPATQNESYRLSGSGDGYFHDSTNDYPVITGKVTFKAKGPYVN